ncbi:MAG: hypothetical protein Q8N14_01050 [Candidatus Omnitrophota bacterium]|nr:hypothetical protein [Candidatus Omnitrophota bacterium]
MFHHDQTASGWTLLEPGFQPLPSILLPGDLEFIKFLTGAETSIDGEELVLRARGELNADNGQQLAELMLNNRQVIPAYLTGQLLIFPKTIWLDQQNRRRVACLNLMGGKCEFSYDLLNARFSAYYLLVRLVR